MLAFSMGKVKTGAVGFICRAPPVHSPERMTSPRLTAASPGGVPVPKRHARRSGWRSLPATPAGVPRCQTSSTASPSTPASAAAAPASAACASGWAMSSSSWLPARPPSRSSPTTRTWSVTTLPSPSSTPPGGWITRRSPRRSPFGAVHFRPDVVPGCHVVTWPVARGRAGRGASRGPGSRRRAAARRARSAGSRRARRTRATARPPRACRAPRHVGPRSGRA